jgi:beta-lactamase superfamily II metal-dependent hydrolase
LWPKASNESGTAANSDSVVLKIRDGRVRFLLTGDVE